MGIAVPASISLRCDNHSTLVIPNDAAYHATTKHIDIDVRYHWIRDAVERKEFLLRYVYTIDQCVDMLIKILKTRSIFAKSTLSIDLCSCRRAMNRSNFEFWISDLSNFALQPYQ